MLKAGVVGIISFWFIFDILRLERENQKTEETIKHISKKIEKLKFKNSGIEFVQNINCIYYIILHCALS